MHSQTSLRASLLEKSLLRLLDGCIQGWVALLFKAIGSPRGRMRAGPCRPVARMGLALKVALGTVQNPGKGATMCSERKKEPARSGASCFLLTFR
jgi:hypothetical protein